MKLYFCAPKKSHDYSLVLQRAQVEGSDRGCRLGTCAPNMAHGFVGCMNGVCVYSDQRKVVIANTGGIMRSKSPFYRKSVSVINGSKPGSTETVEL